jgi:hypothetical protein
VFYVHPSGTFTSIGSEGGLNCKYHEAAPADLGDVMAWTIHYGIHILPVFDNSTELLPE